MRPLLPCTHDRSLSPSSRCPLVVGSSRSSLVWSSALAGSSVLTCQWLPPGFVICCHCAPRQPRPPGKTPAMYRQFTGRQGAQRWSAPVVGAGAIAWPRTGFRWGLCCSHCARSLPPPPGKIHKVAHNLTHNLGALTDAALPAGVVVAPLWSGHPCWASGGRCTH